MATYASYVSLQWSAFYKHVSSWSLTTNYTAGLEQLLISATVTGSNGIAASDVSKCDIAQQVIEAFDVEFSWTYMVQDLRCNSKKAYKLAITCERKPRILIRIDLKYLFGIRTGEIPALSRNVLPKRIPCGGWKHAISLSTQLITGKKFWVNIKNAVRLSLHRPGHCRLIIRAGTHVIWV